jgi:uncharacterized membrane protein YkoI
MLNKHQGVGGTDTGYNLIPEMVHIRHTDRHHLRSTPVFGAPRVSLQQAVAIASEHTRGIAIDANLESGKRRNVYAILMRARGHSLTVKVDATDGSIIDL